MSRYIDADALKRYIDDCDVCTNCKEKKLSCEIDCPMPDCLTKNLERVIDEQPTVDAVPVRHGEWNPHPIKGCEEWDVCSACGIGTHRRLVSDLGEEEYSYSYCPWCGAKMDCEQ